MLGLHGLASNLLKIPLRAAEYSFPWIWCLPSSGLSAGSTPRWTPTRSTSWCTRTFSGSSSKASSPSSLCSLPTSGSFGWLESWRWSCHSREELENWSTFISSLTISSLCRSACCSKCQDMKLIGLFSNDIALISMDRSIAAEKTSSILMIEEFSFNKN